MKTVIIFYKALFIGSVKTRLAASLGDRAMDCYRAMMTYLDREIRGDDYAVIHAIDRSASREKCFWKPDMVQLGSSLAMRMHNAFATVFTQRPGKILLMGSDVPDIREADLQAAFAVLDAADITIMPSTDGGYGLIGMRETLPIFTQKCLSSKDIRDFAARKHYRLQEGNMITDIDTIEDLHLFLNKKEKNDNQQALCNKLQKYIG